ncbi:hypothetical protein FHG28_11210 [Shigella sonnei]|nr:hypothetical protein [Escherichia coli]EFW7606676.1 hypothetical protein [Shigella sonnei]
MNFLSTHHFLYSCLNNFFEIEARNKESLNCTTPCVGLAQIRKANLPRPSGCYAILCLRPVPVLFQSDIHPRLLLQHYIYLLLFHNLVKQRN